MFGAATNCGCTADMTLQLLKQLCIWGGEWLLSMDQSEVFLFLWSLVHSFSNLNEIVLPPWCLEH